MAFLGRGYYLSWHKLPISVAEHITMAYAFCGLLTSFLWWEKPLNVSQPTMINDRSLHGLFAYLCFLSTFDCWNDFKHLVDHNSGEVIGKGDRRDKAVFYEHNEIDDLVFQRIAKQYKIYKQQDQLRWAMTSIFLNQDSHESCYFELPAKSLLVDRSSDCPDELRPQNLWDLLKKPMSEKKCDFESVIKLSVCSSFFLLPFVVSVIGYFLNRGSVMGFLDGLPLPPFLPINYTWYVRRYYLVFGLLVPGFVYPLAKD